MSVCVLDLLKILFGDVSQPVDGVLTFWKEFVIRQHEWKGLVRNNLDDMALVS